MLQIEGNGLQIAAQQAGLIIGLCHLVVTNKPFANFKRSALILFNES